MKLDKLKDRLLEVLPSNLSIYEGKDDFFKYSCSISGFINKNYFHIYLMQCDKRKIELSYNTQEPLEIVKLIKSIDKTAKVKYYEISYNEKIV